MCDAVGGIIPYASLTSLPADAHGRLARSLLLLRTECVPAGQALESLCSSLRSPYDGLSASTSAILALGVVSGDLANELGLQGTCAAESNNGGSDDAPSAICVRVGAPLSSAALLRASASASFGPRAHPLHRWVEAECLPALVGFVHYYETPLALEWQVPESGKWLYQVTKR